MIFKKVQEIKNWTFLPMSYFCNKYYNCMLDNPEFEKWQFEKILEYKLAEMEYISKITYELKARLIQQELLMETEAQSKI